VVGLHRFIFDVWGDPVNVASRMESHGVASRVQLSHASWLLARDHFSFEPRGSIDVKGKGPMDVYLLVQ
jgi:class 3 adenylate cyclase